MCMCQSVCLFVSLLKAANHNWFKNAWNFPNWLYFYVIQCSGLTQYIHAIAVGLIPGCMCFESINRENIYWFLFTEAKEQCIVDFMQKIVRSVEKVSPYANVDLKLKKEVF